LSAVTVAKAEQLERKSLTFGSDVKANPKEIYREGLRRVAVAGYAAKKNGKRQM